MSSIRESIGQTLLELAATDQRIVVLSADLSESMKVLEFKASFPDRFFDVGVAEQNMAGLSAGLAMSGKVPFLMSFAVFSPGFNLSMIRTICYSNLPVKIVGGHAGLATGPDGATHQALEDIALMRTLPNMSVVVPSSAGQAVEVVKAAAQTKGPTYIRSTRAGDGPLLESLDQQPRKFKLGKAELLHPGTDATILATGTMVEVALQTANQLKFNENLNIRVMNFHTIKPLDRKTIFEVLKKTGAILTLEDHQVSGGFGSAIAEVIVQENIKKPFKIMGVDDSFGESGSIEELYQKHGLTAENVASQLKGLI